MTRVEQIGRATLYLADCTEALDQIEAADALITDPPFGVGFKYESHNDSPEGYIEWLWPIIERAEALLSPGAPVFVWQGAKNIRLFSQWFPREWRLFSAGKNFVQMRPTVMQWAWDPIVCWWTPGERPWTAGTQNRDFAISNTAGIISSTDNLERGHPCPRPLDLLDLIVRQWVKPGGVLLDPFMGSGTAGVAAVRAGRGFIGIEKEPAYFEIACERVARASGQDAGPLFGEAA